MTRKTPSDLAWSKNAELIKTPNKLQQEEVSFSLDSAAIAEALGSKLQVQRSEQDEKLIKFMFIGIVILASTTVLCALISLITVISVTKNKK